MGSPRDRVRMATYGIPCACRLQPRPGQGKHRRQQGKHPRRLEGSREGAAGADCRLGWGCELLLPAPDEHHDVTLGKPCKRSA